MPSRLKKNSLFFLAIFILIAGFCGGTINKKDYQAQASLWDAIRAWVTINPLEVEVSAPKEVEVNKVFKITAKVINKGEEKIKNAKGEIFLPEGVEGIDFLKKNPVQKIGVIHGKKSKKISWTARGTKIGTEIEGYIITVSVTGELKENLIGAEDSVLVIIEDPQEKSQSRKWYQNLFDFFRGWFK